MHKYVKPVQNLSRFMKTTFLFETKISQRVLVSQRIWIWCIKISPLIWLDFLREALTPIFGDQDAGILEFLLHISIVIFDAEQVHLRQQVTYFKIKEVTTKPKS